MQIDLGRVTPIYRGNYSAAESYELNDIVLYTDGCLYWHTAEAPTTGVAPTVTAAWTLAFSGADVQAALAQLVTQAQAAKTAAETAQGIAEAAQTGAESAQAAAENAQSSAENAQDAAEEAQGKAQDAQDAAETAQAIAETAAESMAGLYLSVADGMLCITYEEA